MGIMNQANRPENWGTTYLIGSKDSLVLKVIPWIPDEQFDDVKKRNESGFTASVHQNDIVLMLST